MTAIDELVAAWQAFLRRAPDWQQLTAGVTPKAVGCGLVYELPNLLGRSNEDFAIADMRQLDVSEPHYHPEGVTEVYIVLQGQAVGVVGGKEFPVMPGHVIVTPPRTTHYMVPDNNFVIAVISTPPYAPETYLPITKTDAALGFSRQQFERLRKTATARADAA